MTIRLKYLTVIAFLLLGFANAKSQVEVINAGVGGNTSGQLLSRIAKDVIAHKPDLTIVMVGTNDMLNSRKLSSYAQYQQNLESIIQELKAAGSQVLLMSPPTVDSTYLFMRHNRDLYRQPPNVKLDSVRKIVANLAKEQELMFLDIHQKFSDLSLPKHNQDLFIRNPFNSNAKDGVHPTALGYHFIAENIYQYLKANGMLGRYTKIVCFGDSITKGAGTVTGENYPSYLRIKLNEITHF